MYIRIEVNITSRLRHCEKGKYFICIRLTIGDSTTSIVVIFLLSLDPCSLVLQGSVNSSKNKNINKERRRQTEKRSYKDPQSKDYGKRKEINKLYEIFVEIVK